MPAGTYNVSSDRNVLSSVQVDGRPVVNLQHVQSFLLDAVVRMRQPRHCKVACTIPQCVDDCDRVGDASCASGTATNLYEHAH